MRVISDATECRIFTVGSPQVDPQGGPKNGESKKLGSREKR